MTEAIISKTVIPRNSFLPKDSGFIKIRITAMINGTIIIPD